MWARRALTLPPTIVTNTSEPPRCLAVNRWCMGLAHENIMQFAQRLNHVETSAIRELFKLLGKPGIISFAGGFPDSAMFDVEGIRQASARALDSEAGPSLQYGATEGYNPLREQLAHFMAGKGVRGLSADDLIVTTGSQQALDLLAKVMLDPGDVALVEAPTFQIGRAHV